jgi:hypothetical protein
VRTPGRWGLGAGGWGLRLGGWVAGVPGGCSPPRSAPTDAPRCLQACTAARGRARCRRCWAPAARASRR